jgi:two-component system, cell cycle response regulator
MDSMPERRRGLGLRGRLTAFFVVITVAPLLLVVVALQLQIEDRLRQRSEAELANVQRAASALVEARRARAGDLAGDLAIALAADPAVDLRAPDAAGAVGALLAARGDVAPERADLVVVAGADGRVLARVGRGPDPGADAAPGDPVAAVVAAVRAGAPAPGALVEQRELVGVDDDLLGWVVAVTWADAALLDALGVRGAVALVGDGRVLAVRGAEPEDVPGFADPGGPAPLVVREALRGGEAELVVWASGAPSTSPLVIALVVAVPAVVVAGALGLVLAGSVVAPVRRAADVARAVAAGNLSQRLEGGGGPELDDLSGALNAMSAELAARLDELEERDRQLRGSLDRLGETLSSSLDRERTLSVVVDTAVEALGADRAVLLMLDPGTAVLESAVLRGIAAPGPRLAVGEGVIGRVAATATPVHVGPGTEGAGRARVPGEPAGADELVVPLLVRGRVLGVVALLRDDGDRPFAEGDLATLRSFVGQAAVAVENVVLHEEAQRLSLTDPLTGLWNFRYFQIQAHREAEVAARGDRPLSLVVIDVDRFKDVNDEHGHQVGDEVLVAIADRLREATRLPDVVARYGGEEFVVLLPGTDTAGAMATAERIRAAVAGAPIRAADPDGGAGAIELRVTCSVGVATLGVHGGAVAGLLRAADLAMYAAKRGGRDAVVLAGG